ncbi:ATP-binding protein [Amnibacterium kyonggiense]|uniref:ATPase family protein associated with various cellular activities (AAA) n=1 Tax=Amnibacterium kyonggiense TaxID=595671 RepID=A0A4R7FJ71_9MICO|nr:AAA family ATPase [Amnibacterium kyonggiense]TDS76092.1 ATPase family protein associated with various cellular activities (AAA) [Amnibacterium kyonggiense]
MTTATDTTATTATTREPSPAVRARTRIRDFHDDDLDGVTRLFEQAEDAAPVYSLSEVAASCQKDHAVVAVDGDRVVGSAVARAAHAQGWLVFFRIDRSRGEDPDLARDLLDALQRRLTPLGLSKLSVLVPDHMASSAAFTDHGFRMSRQLRYLERRMPVERRELPLLREVGGRLLPPDLWQALSGMNTEKAMLDERLIAPLVDPELAARFGVVPPRTVMLFGPPGTGKTTFARAIASRLAWPFVEVFPSRLGDSAATIAGALRSTFETVERLEHAVVFMDEVEEIASHRRGDPPSPTQGVTNELLKLIPEFRSGPGKLLICATNFIRSLDGAFLRHGRFDAVIPIGLPDREARMAIWDRLLPPSRVGLVDVARLVALSDGMTPADIEYAARHASQDALGRALAVGRAPALEEGPTTEDCVRALSGTRATVTREAVIAFEDDIARFARV